MASNFESTAKVEEQPSQSDPFSALLYKTSPPALQLTNVPQKSAESTESPSQAPFNAATIEASAFDQSASEAPSQPVALSSNNLANQSVII